jgi:hypothetical protein
MSFRYRLRVLAPADTAEALLAEIFPQGNGSGPLIGQGGAPKVPWLSVVDHLRAIGTKTLLIQSGVSDPDFLEEHQAFYAKQHRPVLSTCVRVHAFAHEFVQPVEPGQAPDVLAFLDTAAKSRDSYLGFVTVRPLRHAPVGATILRPSPARLPTAIDEFPVHIAGNEFFVAGTPFLQQDNAVGACAQASIWMALRTLRRRVGNSAYSPAELTVAATRYLASERTFPGRQGLTAGQMLEAVRTAGHDPLYVGLRPSIANAPSPTANTVVAKSAPYTASGLPVICILFAPDGGHAVVAIGHTASQARVQPLPRQQVHPQTSTVIPYSMSSDWISGLTIHNDNTGPYLSLTSGTATAPRPYCLEHAAGLIVPLPEGVYTNADEAEIMAVRAILFASVWFSIAAAQPPQLPQVPYVLYPYLCTRHAFRHWAKNDPDLDPEARNIYRTITLPKVLWVIEVHEESLYDPTDSTKKSRCGEIVLDPAADALHGDAMIFARVTKDLWPNTNSFQGVLLIEDEESIRSLALNTGARSAALAEPWYS